MVVAFFFLVHLQRSKSIVFAESVRNIELNRVEICQNARRPRFCPVKQMVAAAMAVVGSWRCIRVSV